MALPHSPHEEGKFLLGGINPDLFDELLVGLPLVEPEDGWSYVPIVRTVTAKASLSTLQSL